MQTAYGAAADPVTEGAPAAGSPAAGDSAAGDTAADGPVAGGPVAAPAGPAGAKEPAGPAGPVPPAARSPVAPPVGKRARRSIPQDVKIAVSARDGGRCRQCGSTAQLHFDHVIPISRGGANTVANIQLLCGACNRAKGAKLKLAARAPPMSAPGGYRPSW